MSAEQFCVLYKKGQVVTPKVIWPSESIIIPINPKPKPRMVKSDAYRKRPVVLKYWAWKDEITKICSEMGFKLPDTFKITFVMPMPDSWSLKKKVEMKGKPHQQRPDVDNCTKAVMDCLKDQDCTVWHVEMKKIWGETGLIIINKL